MPDVWDVTSDLVGRQTTFRLLVAGETHELRMDSDYGTVLWFEQLDAYRGRDAALVERINERQAALNDCRERYAALAEDATDARTAVDAEFRAALAERLAAGAERTELQRRSHLALATPITCTRLNPDWTVERLKALPDGALWSLLIDPFLTWRQGGSPGRRVTEQAAASPASASSPVRMTPAPPASPKRRRSNAA